MGWSGDRSGGENNMDRTQTGRHGSMNGDQNHGQEKNCSARDIASGSAAANPAGSGPPQAMRPGVLYIVGTPIGNLGDLSPRAAAILGEADCIAAEDTRRTLQLLNHLGLKKRLVSYHQHNQRHREAALLDILLRGERLALVSDAGMPGISDPGSAITAACIEAGIDVTVVPGPSAAFVALAASGLVTDRFAFEGFIPASGKLRKARILELAGEKRTLVLYEAPHRILKTICDLQKAGLAARRLTIARELTKRHETFYRACLADVCSQPEMIEQRGEFVLVIEGLDAYSQRCPELPGPDEGGQQSPAAGSGGSQFRHTANDAAPLADDQDAGQLKALLSEGLSVKDAVRRLAPGSGRNRNALYALALSIQAGHPDDAGQTETQQTKPDSADKT